MIRNLKDTSSILSNSYIFNEKLCDRAGGRYYRGKFSTKAIYRVFVDLESLCFFLIFKAGQVYLL